MNWKIILAAGAILFSGTHSGNAMAVSSEQDWAESEAFVINTGLNDAWYDPETSGQGFFITVIPDLGVVSLAWLTYDTELPPIGATANLGDPGHRWLTAVGPFEGNQALMDIEMTSGGIFDASTEIQRTEPAGSGGTIILTFDSCSSGTVEYDIPSINRQGIVPIQRVANENMVLCEPQATCPCIESWSDGVAAPSVSTVDLSKFDCRIHIQPVYAEVQASYLDPTNEERAVSYSYWKFDQDVACSDNNIPEAVTDYFYLNQFSMDGFEACARLLSEMGCKFY